MVTIQDFMNFEFIVAEIKEVKEHPDADKLYVLQVETGSGMKQLVAGIRKSYGPEQLVGKRIIMINNLEPAVIRGQESQGMLLAASGERGPVLLTPDGDVPLGAKVR
ncbi:MAG TPA: methionine--tRNA ligase subunit beta [Candidatus Omnitrophota bacterium]|nr:methionine--tRNA ligase subunit beta [Candidatus Omnitrophota bacterium]HSA31063.1 methionine--tRNA ligase subunit beta [Candidatus Omnitrophota bacterium]